MSNRNFKISLAFILLLVGGTLYIAFRTKRLAMFTWAKWLNLDSYVEMIRSYAIKYHPPYFVKYCLPNALWTSSYIIITDALVSKECNGFLWAISLPIIALFFEIMQIWQIIPGTFDIGDLLCFAVPIILYVFYYFGYEKNN